MTEEGVIQFTLDHHHEPLGGLDLSSLKAWFSQCKALGLVGIDPARYGGAAYGNISRRHEGGFLITGTQTGALAQLSDEHVSWVIEVEPQRNRVRSRGLWRPSSESMTHATLYQAPVVGAVIHVHCPRMWRLSLPSTPSNIAYGTPEMATSVAQLLSSEEVLLGGVIRMGGHEDGVLFFGSDLGDAGAKLLRSLG